MNRFLMQGPKSLKSVRGEYKNSVRWKRFVISFQYRMKARMRLPISRPLVLSGTVSQIQQLKGRKLPTPFSFNAFVGVTVTPFKFRDKLDFYKLYTVSQKRPTSPFVVTLTNIDRFAKFFPWCNLWKLYNNVIIKSHHALTASLLSTRYTTLGKYKFSKIHVSE